MPNPDLNRRRFQRILYRTPARFIDAAGKDHPCEVIDLSLHGCLLRFSESFSSDQGVLQIDLDGGATIEMALALVHQRGQSQGFVCARIDLDSLTRLRRLVELNLGDPRLLERDLSALCTPAD